MESSGPANRFETVVFRWIMTARDHNRAVSLKMDRRIIKHWRRHNTDVEHRTTSSQQPLQQSIVQTIAAQPAVSSKANAATAMANKISTQTSAERFDISIKQFFICDSADIVLTEDSLFEHKYQNSWTEQNSEPFKCYLSTSRRVTRLSR